VAGRHVDGPQFTIAKVLDERLCGVTCSLFVVCPSRDAVLYVEAKDSLKPVGVGLFGIAEPRQEKIGVTHDSPFAIIRIQGSSSRLARLLIVPVHVPDAVFAPVKPRDMASGTAHDCTSVSSSRRVRR